VLSVKVVHVQLRHIKLVYNSFAATVLIFSCIGATMLVAFVTAVLLVKHKAHPLIRGIAPKLGLVCCFGALCGALASLLLLVQPSTPVCSSIMWLSSLSITFVYSTMFVRLYRCVFSPPSLC
jgi:hypothetical protein